MIVLIVVLVYQNVHLKQLVLSKLIFQPIILLLIGWNLKKSSVKKIYEKNIYKDFNENINKKIIMSDPGGAQHK